MMHGTLNIKLITNISEFRANSVSVVANLIKLTTSKVGDEIHMTVIKVLLYENLEFVEHAALRNLYGGVTTQPVLWLGNRLDDRRFVVRTPV
jgi:hypothetical protein